MLGIQHSRVWYNNICMKAWYQMFKAHCGCCWWHVRLACVYDPKIKAWVHNSTRKYAKGSYFPMIWLGMKNEPYIMNLWAVTSTPYQAYFPFPTSGKDHSKLVCIFVHSMRKLIIYRSIEPHRHCYQLRMPTVMILWLFPSSVTLMHPRLKEHIFMIFSTM